MKAFMEIIRRLDRGQLNRDLEKALDDIAQAIEANGGKGSVTIKLEIGKKGDAYQFDGKLDHSLPKKPRLGSIMFFDADKGEFTGRDPRQPSMLDDDTVETFKPARDREQNNA